MTPIFPVPAPSWIWGVLSAIGYAILLLGLDPLLPFTLMDVRFAPVTAPVGAALYFCVIWTIDQRDPRLWRDRSRFADYVQTWARMSKGEPISEGETEQLRALTWRDASVAMAQQAGATAGAGAGVTLLDRSWPLAVVVFGITMLLVGLTVKWLLMEDCRSSLSPLIVGDDD